VGDQDEENDSVAIDPMEEDDLVSEDWKKLQKDQKSGRNDAAEVHHDADLVDLAGIVRNTFAWSSAEHRNRFGRTEDIVEVHVRRSSEKKAKESTGKDEPCPLD
jgi:hypothetical protein